MAFAYSDLQAEVLRRALRNQGGGQYTTAINNAINLSMWRIARDAKWRTLRRKAVFNTVTTYSNGTGAASCTNGSKVFSVTGATFISDGIRLGRYIKFDGSVIYFKIASITSETAGTLDQVFDGTTSTTLGYAISPQEEYVLPIQIGHSAFFWHRKYGMPKVMKYVPAYDFYQAGVLDILTNIPVAYRMWGMDATIEQPINPSIMTISSNNSTDTNIAVTVFGTVNGYPDYEIITTDASNGTKAVNGAKTFSYVERIVKNQSTAGLITITANAQVNTYSFTVSGITNAPEEADTYSNNGTTFTINYINLTGATGAQIGTFTATGTGAPLASGTLTKVSSPTGDTTITFTAAPQQTITIGVLPVGSTTTGPMYTKVQVYPLPNTVFPINCYYYKLPYQLINAGDVSELGEDFSEAIILLASAKLKAEQNLTQDATNFMQLFKDEIDSLKKTNLDKIDWKMILKQPGDGDNDVFTGGLRFSQIGGSGQYGGSWNP